MIQVQILFPDSIEDQKQKGFRRKLKGFCPLNRVKTKKKKSSSPQFDSIFGRNSGCIRTDRHYFV